MMKKLKIFSAHVKYKSRQTFRIFLIQISDHQFIIIFVLNMSTYQHKAIEICLNKILNHVEHVFFFPQHVPLMSMHLFCPCACQDSIYYDTVHVPYQP